MTMTSSHQISLKDQSLLYFERFSAKDLSGLEKIFAEDVHLRDWELTADGKAAVLEANRNIFDQVRSIEAKPLKLYEEAQTVIAELEVIVNGGEEILLVVDILDFNLDGRIHAIRAYKG